MTDKALREEARKAVAELDLAAWERVRVLMLRAGAAETEEAAIERTRASETFLKDIKRMADSVLADDRTVGSNLYGGADSERDLIRRLLNDESVVTKPGRAGALGTEYIKASDIAVALNRAFGITGWSIKIKSLRFLETPHRINSMRVPQADGQYWDAVAISVVELKVSGPGGRTCEREDVGVGTAVGGKAQSRTDAAQNAITSAVTTAFKRAARFMGPATGLTLAWSEPLKQELRSKLEAAVSAGDES